MKKSNNLVLCGSILLASCVLSTGMAAISALTGPKNFLANVIGIPYYMGIFLVVAGISIMIYEDILKKK